MTDAEFANTLGRVLVTLACDGVSAISTLSTLGWIIDVFAAFPIFFWTWVLGWHESLKQPHRGKP